MNTLNLKRNEQILQANSSRLSCRHPDPNDNRNHYKCILMNLADIDIQARSLAEKILDYQAWGRDELCVPELCAEEKRFLTERGYSYSYNGMIHEWEIQLNTGQ